MTSCKECGQELPPEARFCMHCGTPVNPPEPEPPVEPVEPIEPAPQPPKPELDFLRPSVAGGVFLGLLSSMPVINAGNCLCCMWILAGGALAAYLLMKQRPEPGGVTYGDAAFAGVMSGLFGALVSTVLSIPIKAATAGFWEEQRQAIEGYFQNIPGLEGPMKDLIIRAISPEVSPITLIFTFVSNLILYSLFAMIGAIVFVAIQNRKRPAGRAPNY